MDHTHGETGAVTDPGEQTRCTRGTSRTWEPTQDAWAGKTEIEPFTLSIQRAELNHRHTTGLLQPEPASRGELGLRNKGKALVSAPET